MKKYTLVYNLILKSDDRHLVHNKAFIEKLLDLLKSLECTDVESRVRYSITFTSRKNGKEIAHAISEKFSKLIYFQLIPIQEPEKGQGLDLDEGVDLEFKIVIEKFWKRVNT